MFTRQTITAAASVLVLAGRSLCADQPFEVSLSSPKAVDLSPYYQRVVRKATEEYRGDVPDSIAVQMTHIAFGVYVGTPLLPVPPELAVDFEPLAVTPSWWTT